MLPALSPVTNYDMTLELKGKTVMSERERYDTVKHCRYVDEVLEGCPWVITPEFLEEHQVKHCTHCSTDSYMYIPCIYHMYTGCMLLCYRM